MYLLESEIISIRKQILSFKKNKIVAYTVNLGMTKNELLLNNISNDIDYFIFTDINIEHNKNIHPIKVSFSNKNLRVCSRIFKINPHIFFSEYEVSIYLDSNIALKKDIDLFIPLFINSDKNIALFKHSKRNCLYDEATECIKVGRGKKEDIIKQVHAYETIIPKNYGLYSCGFIVRKHNYPSVINAMNLWFNELLLYSERDQISFPYVLKISNLPLLVLDGEIYDSTYTKVVPQKIVEFTNKNRVASLKILLYNAKISLLKIFRL